MFLISVKIQEKISYFIIEKLRDWKFILTQISGEKSEGSLVIDEIR